MSLLCNVSKVLEKLVYDKIINFITESISLVQFGVVNSPAITSIFELCAQQP